MIPIKKIKDELMSRIDSSSPLQVEKVERYIYLVGLNRELQKKVKEEGAISHIINGSQEYKKEHPALNQIDKINKNLLNIERTFEFDEGTPVTEKVGVSLT